MDVLTRSYANVRISKPSNLPESETNLPKFKLQLGLGHLTVNGDSFSLMFKAGKQNSAKKLGNFVHMKHLSAVTYMLTVQSSDSLLRTYCCEFPSQHSAAAFSNLAEFATASTKYLSDFADDAAEHMMRMESETSSDQTLVLNSASSSPTLEEPGLVISLSDALKTSKANRRVHQMILDDHDVAYLQPGTPSGELIGPCAASHQGDVTKLVDEELTGHALQSTDVAVVYTGEAGGQCVASCRAQVMELAEKLAHLTHGTCPNEDEAEWQRRCKKRLAAIEMIKASAEYKVAMLSGSIASRPRTPSPGDRSVTKRKWEQNVSNWRTALRSCCASDEANTPELVKGDEHAAGGSKL